MALQIRRGSNTQRLANRYEPGELIYTTDYKDLFVGDGMGGTLGGIRIAPVKSVNGLVGSEADGAVTLTTTNIAEGSNKYYSSTQARIDAGAALVGGNGGNTGISFTYRSNDNTITAVVTAGGYDLPTAAPTELGGVKISQGGLQIDGGGLVSLITPVSAGTINQLTYYTGVNAVSQTGAGLTWRPTGNLYAGGQVTVTGTVDTHRINISTAADNGFYMTTEMDGDAANEVCTINTAHNGTNPTASRFFRSRGTIASPTTVLNTDKIYDFQFAAITGASSSGLVAQIRVAVNGTVSAGVVPGKITMSTAKADGTLVDGLIVAGDSTTFETQARFADGTAADPSIAFTTDGGVDTGFSHPGDGIIVVSTNATETARFDSGGFRSVGFIKVKDFAGNLPNPPEAGMIVLDGTTFKGYNGSAWVNLN